ncbi:hypothetical protein HPB47_026258 [Ixodes persulcatus]|uniref:Uncharacterized protein n=1 Tax=Ixodes persulcatus TaxID=34615 RepID=A0AC60PZ99_IXOPE|nr:hypothetical protein HPB47_026258 [Ixodes persulcatus]
MADVVLINPHPFFLNREKALKGEYFVADGYHVHRILGVRKMSKLIKLQVKKKLGTQWICERHCLELPQIRSCSHCTLVLPLQDKRPQVVVVPELHPPPITMILLLQQGVHFGNIATPDYLRTGQLPRSRPLCSIVDDDEQTWAGQDSQQVTSNGCARSPAMMNYTDRPQRLTRHLLCTIKEGSTSLPTTVGLAARSQRGCLIHYCFLYRTTWRSFDVQPKARLHGASSAISLRQIAGTSAGVRTRYMGSVGQRSRLGATEAAAQLARRSRRRRARLGGLRIPEE